MRRGFSLILADPFLRLCFLAELCFGAFVASIGPFQSLVAVQDFGLSDQAYAMVLLAGLLAGVGSALAIGIATDRFPLRRAMALLASGALALGGGLVWLGNSVPALVLAHVLCLPVAGTLFGQVFATARLHAAPLPEAERDSVMAVLRAAMALPWVVVTPLWGLAVAHGLPKVDIYGGLMVLGLVQTALIARQWPRDGAVPWAEAKSGLSFRASLSEVMAAPVALRVMLMGTVHSGAAVGGVILGLTFAEAGRGAGEVSLFFTLFVAIEVLGTLALSRFRRMGSRLGVIGAGAVVYAVFLGLLPVLAGTPLIWLLCLPAGLGGALIYTLAIGYLQDLLGTRAGAGASLIALQRIAAEGLGFVIYALGALWAGYWLVALMASATMVAAIIALIRLDRGR